MRLFWKNLSSTPFEKRIGYKFRNPKNLELALKHRSWARENAEGEEAISNERLEFLGDAVLEVIVAEYLFRNFPEYAEGQMTEHRGKLVNRNYLASKAKELGLGEYILMSDGESESGGRHKNSILADAYEALIGAIFIDGGLSGAKMFVEGFHLANLDLRTVSVGQINYKGRLLERLQAIGKRPEYRVLSEMGPDHLKRFEVAVYIGGKEAGVGFGSCKKEAEQDAARVALSQRN